MNRGEIWTVAGGPDYAGKPRPVMVIQDDRFAETLSVTICPLTSVSVPASLVRIPVPATEASGLRVPSFLMVDKLTTVQRSKLGRKLGVAPDDVLPAVRVALMVFLGLAG